MKDDGQGHNETVELVRASQAADAGAFDQLVRMYQRRAMRVALGMLGNVHDAAEVVQEAFVKGYLRIGSLREPDRFEHWLLRIVANEALGRHRAARRRGAMMRLFVAAGARNRPRRPEENERTKDLTVAVERAMMHLTGKEAQAIALFGLDDLPYHEVARLMGCSAGAARWHVCRARQKLRVLLKEYLQ